MKLDRKTQGKAHGAEPEPQVHADDLPPSGQGTRLGLDGQINDWIDDWRLWKLSPRDSWGLSVP